MESPDHAVPHSPCRSTTFPPPLPWPRFTLLLVPPFLLFLLLVSARAIAAATLLNPSPGPSSTGFGESMAPVISGDGSRIAFVSTADNLVTNDANRRVADVFVRDFATASTLLVSVGTNLTSGNGASREASFSRDGRRLAFTSDATDLVAADTNGLPDVFVRDLATDVTLLASRSTNGASANGESRLPRLSADGRFLAFESRATDLVRGATNRFWNLFLLELGTGQITWLNPRSTLPLLVNRPATDASEPLLAADGSTVVFGSEALNLATAQRTNPPVSGLLVTNNLYVRRPSASAPRMVHVSTNPPTSSRQRVASVNPSLSDDGRFLALFRSPTVTNVTGRDMDANFFHVDLDTGTFQRIGTNLPVLAPYGVAELGGPLLSADGQTVIFERREGIPADRHPWRPVIYTWNAATGEARRVANGELLAASRDGRFVAFRGANTNDPPGSPTDQIQIRDLLTGELRRVSRSPSGTPISEVNFPSGSFSDDGHRFAFQTRSADLVPDDRNAATDVFAYDWDTDQLQLVSARAASLPNRTVQARTTMADRVPVLSTDGRWFVFNSEVADLATGIVDTNQLSDVFVQDRTTGSNLLVSVAQGTRRSGHGRSSEGTISPDGRWIAFGSTADDLADGDTNRLNDVFLHDLASGTTVLLSRRIDGNPSQAESRRPVFSPDGTSVAFESDEALDAQDVNRTTDIYLYHLERRQLTWVSSIPALASPTSKELSVRPVFSPAGHWLAFATLSPHVPPSSFAAGGRWIARHLPTQEQRSLIPVTASTKSFLLHDLVFSADESHAAAVTWTIQGQSQLWLADLRSTNEPPTLVATNALPGALGPLAHPVVYRDRGTNSSQASVVRLVDPDTQLDVTLTGSEDSVTDSFRVGNVLLGTEGRFVIFARRKQDRAPTDPTTPPELCIHDRLSGTRLAIPGAALAPAPVLSNTDGSVLFVGVDPDPAAGDFNLGSDLYTLRLPTVESEFRIAEIRRLGARGVTLVWATSPARHYEVLVAETVNGPWRSLPLVIRIEGSQASADDPDSNPGDTRFYRITESPAR